MKKILTIATLTMAMTAAPLTAHAETVDEANQATQTAYQAYQQAETEKIQAWNDSHGDIYSDAWQTADAKSKALYNAYLDARQHAGLVSAEAKRDQSVSNSDVSESQSSSESQSLSEGQAEGQVSDTQSSKVSTSNQSSSTSDQPSSDSNANLTSDAIPTVTKSTSQDETAHNSVSRTSNTLPQTGNDKENRTALALIGSGVMGIATAAMMILIRERRLNEH